MSIIYGVDEVVNISVEGRRTLAVWVFFLFWGWVCWKGWIKDSFQSWSSVIPWLLLYPFLIFCERVGDLLDTYAFLFRSPAASISAPDCFRSHSRSDAVWYSGGGGCRWYVWWCVWEGCTPSLSSVFVFVVWVREGCSRFWVICSWIYSNKRIIQQYKQPYFVDFGQYRPSLIT